MRLQRFFLFAILLVAAVAASSARADFAGGLETFNGTVPDANNWELFLDPTTSFAQNNAITFVTSYGRWAEYTTRSARVGVGGTVRVQVSASAGTVNPLASLYLSTNSGGTNSLTVFDDHWLSMDLFSNSGGIYAWFGGNGSGQGDVVAQVPQGINTTYQLEIARTSLTQAQFRAYDTANTLLGTRTLTFSGFPSDLSVTILAQDCTATFDNVQLSGNFVVPEPNTLLLALTPALALLPRRRRTQTMRR